VRRGVTEQALAGSPRGAGLRAGYPRAPPYGRHGRTPPKPLDFGAPALSCAPARSVPPLVPPTLRPSTPLRVLLFRFDSWSVA
jgi:hypothetical protein